MKFEKKYCEEITFEDIYKDFLTIMIEGILSDKKDSSNPDYEKTPKGIDKS